MAKLRTRCEQMTSGGLDGYSNFAGDDSDYRDWYGVVGRSRDSDCLEESNFAMALKRLGGEDSEDVLVARYGHWAVGWVEEVYVRPETKAADEAQKIVDELESYPVLDDDDFNEREYNKACEIWKGCFDDKDRLEYIRKHRDQFEFYDFADLRANVKGECFAGYASELLD